MKRIIRTLDGDETYRLLQFFLNNEHSSSVPKIRTRNHCLAVLMLDSGLRVSEACQMLVSDLYFAGNPVNELVVRDAMAKGHRERSIPTTDRLRKSIEQMYAHWWSEDVYLGNGYAFYVANPAAHLTTRQVERIIARAAYIILERTVTPHMLRHTFATRLMRVSNIRVVQSLLGHKSITSTQIYTHPNSDDLKKAIKTM